MESKRTVADNLRAGCTPSGRSRTHWSDGAIAKNHAYRVVDDLFERICGQALENCYRKDEKADARIERAIEALLANIGNPVHFRGREPGMFGSKGEQLFLEPSFSFCDLVSMGEDTYDGFTSFLHACEMPLDISRKALLGCAALLDIDVALDEIERNEAWRASWTMYGIAQSADEIQEILQDEYHREKRREIAAKAGAAAHKDTNEYKIEVLQAWAEKRFKTIAACARWACRQFPIDADETPKRWIRAYEKALLSQVE